MADNGIGDYFIRDVEEEAVEEDDDFLAQPVVVPVAPVAAQPVAPPVAQPVAQPIAEPVVQPIPVAAPIVPAAPQPEAQMPVTAAPASAPPSTVEVAPLAAPVATPAAMPVAAVPAAAEPEPAPVPVERRSPQPATPVEPAPARPSTMVRDMTREERLAQALDELMIGSPDIQAAALVSLDGFTMASALPAGMQEDRVGAMSAAILALGERAAAELGRGRLSQVFIEGQDGYVLLMASGTRAVLTCLADADAKLGLVLYDMRSAAETIGGIVG